MRDWMRILAVSGWLLPVAATAACATGVSLGEALTVIKAHRFIDLTHSFAPGIPHWKGAPDERIKTLYTVEKDGFRIDETCHVGQ